MSSLYLEHFRLSEPPFGLTPNGRFFFEGSTRRAILEALQHAVPDLDILWREDELKPYECDGLSAYRCLPLAVVLPRTTEEVSAALRVCWEEGVPVVVLAIVLACAVLTYGGVSLFVVAFAVYPIAAALFRQADLPKRLIPGTIALGAFTFTMTALPGTPAIQNAIPMPYFGTTPFAAPGLGLIGGAVMLVLGTLWLVRRAATATARGEGYGEHDEAVALSDPASAARARGGGRQR